MPKKKTTGQRRAELKALAADARDTLFQMLAIANELLLDRDYVEEHGGEPQLLEDMEKREFSWFGGSPSLSDLIDAYRANPNKATWDEHDGNVWVMIELAQEPAEPNKPREHKSWRPIAEELEAECKLKTQELEHYRSLVDELRNRVHSLEEELAETRGQLKAMREMREHAAIS